MNKRIVYMTAGVLVLSAGIYLSAKLWAQGPAAAAAQPTQTHIALLNLGYVGKHYQKVEAYSNEMKEQEKVYVNKMKEKRDLVTGRNAELADPKYTEAERGRHSEGNHQAPA